MSGWVGCFRGCITLRVIELDFCSIYFMMYKQYGLEPVVPLYNNERIHGLEIKELGLNIYR